MRIDEPPRKRRVYWSCTVAVCVSAIVAAYTTPPKPRVHLTLTTSNYADGFYHTHNRPGTAPEFCIFTFCVFAAAIGALADLAYAYQSDAAGYRIAEAVASALGAVAVYTTLGGTTLIAALLAAVLTFTSALSDSIYILFLALVATLWDAAFVSGPQSAARAVLAISFVFYSLGIEMTRQKECLNTVIAAAWRVSVVWQAYAVLAGIVSGGKMPNDVMYLATALPLVGVMAFLAVENAAQGKPDSVPLSTEVYCKKSARARRSSPSFRV